MYDHVILFNSKGEVIGYDGTTDAAPGEKIPLMYPRGTVHEGVTDAEGNPIEINPNDRRPTSGEVQQVKISVQQIGGNKTTVLGSPEYGGQILIDKEGKSEKE